MRTVLTAAGVAIGIGAMTSMVSVGLGTQRTVLQAFNEGNILTSIMVRHGEPSDDFTGDSIPPLDSSAVATLWDIPGVRDVYPRVWIAGLLRTGEDQLFRNLDGMPARILAEQVEREAVEVLAGRVYEPGEMNVIVVSENAAEQLLGDSVDVTELLGDTLVFDAARAPSTDGSDFALPDEMPEEMQSQLNALAPLLGSFPMANMLNGMPMGLFEPVRLELEVVGVVRGGGSYGDFVGRSLWAPLELVEPLFSQTYGSLESMLSREIDQQGYPMVQVLAEDIMAVRPVQDSIDLLGFEAQSILDEIDQVRRGFMFMNSLLGTVGGISLFVAAMMIVNTLVMAVWERTREIGLLKSMGATDGDVMRLFLTEAGVIGLLGGVGGLVLGFVVAKFTNFLANIQFQRVGEVSVDLVAFTPWLMLGGMAFAVLVSLIAGYYPARRAAKVDPVVALRHF